MAGSPDPLDLSREILRRNGAGTWEQVLTMLRQDADEPVVVGQPNVQSLQPTMREIGVSGTPLR